MNLYLVRHTTVDSNTGICYGQLDVNVADTFENEKTKILSNLNNINFHKVYSSPLKRCRILAENFNNVIYDNRLMELDFGKWEGLKWTEIEKIKDSKKWFNDFVNVKCPGGESFLDLSKRVESFIEDLKDIDANKNILVFCHAGIIRAFHSIINNIPLAKSFDLKVDYGQVIQITLNKE